MDMQQDELREILEEFYTEAEESLDQLEQDLIELETLATDSAGVTDTDMVDRIFRVLHTLKGGAGFLGLDKMAKVAHAGENLLDEVRAGRVHIDKPVMDALLETNDALKDLLEFQKHGESVEGKDFSPLIERLEDLACAEKAEDLAQAVAAPSAPEPEPVDPSDPTPAVEPPVADVSAASSEPDPDMDSPVDLELDHVAEETSMVNQDLLAQVLGDNSLDPSKDTGADDFISPSAASVGPAEVPTSVETASQPVSEDAPDASVNQELLSQVMGDDSLDPSKDPEASALVVEEVDASVNQELLSQVMGDDSLDPSKDPEATASDSPAASEALVSASVETPKPVVTENVSVPETSSAAPAFSRGEAPAERRATEEDRRQPEERRQPHARRSSDTSNESIRVEVGRLDKVMNLVGELVLARNSLVSQLNQQETREVLEKLHNITLIQSSIEQLSRVTQDLQMSVLSTRMQPIKKVFDKIPRQVRDLKTKLNREVDLVIEGEMTEVDKSLVEELSDPMVHMIRNALDHGIESPDDRKAVGKHPTGTLTVRAFYEGNNVVVQVQEDGKGIDPQAIRRVAVAKGVISETAADALSDEEAVRLILAPGFSTAEVVSDVSGRGVGMDVVNSKITALKGTLDIRSELGFGTTFSIYLPLTLAIVQALVVASNKEGFAVPIGDISEVIQFDPEAIHQMNNQDVIELRGDALPLYYLSKLTKRGFVPPMKAKLEKVTHTESSTPTDGEMSIDDLERAAALAAGESVETAAEKTEKRLDEGYRSNGFVVVVRDGSSSLGLVVDRLVGQEEAVVKPVTEVFEYHEAVSGATITGDGAVHMILDVPYMLKHMTPAHT